MELIDPTQNIKFKQLDETAQLPKRHYAGDCGYDLYVSRTTLIPGRTTVDVPHDVAVELPQGVWGLVIGRSSSIRDLRLMVYPGIIDNGYRGDLFAGVHNLGDWPVEVSVGQRLAQLILMPILSGHPTWVPELAASVRGARGFGSSGQ